MCAVTIKTFKDLVVWQKAFGLSMEIYRLTGSFPKHELFGLSAELRKTARSIVCNIAEGHARKRTLEYIHFLRISAGSAAELDTQILLAKGLGYFDGNAAGEISDTLAEVERMLDALIRSLKKSHNSVP